jgi:tetratricopeptide (TPR) repeat protein
MVCCVLAGCAGAEAAPRSRVTPSASPAALFAHGQRLSAQGDHVRAEQYLRLSMARGYPDHAVVPALVDACITASRLRAALEHAERYLEQHPDELRLRLLTASLYDALEQPERARDELTRVLSSRPDAARAHFQLGVLLARRLEQPAAARAHLLAYLRLSPHGRERAQARALHAELAAADSALEVSP